MTEKKILESFVQDTKNNIKKINQACVNVKPFPQTRRKQLLHQIVDGIMINYLKHQLHPAMRNTYVVFGGKAWDIWQGTHYSLDWDIKIDITQQPGRTLGENMTNYFSEALSQTLPQFGFVTAEVLTSELPEHKTTRWCVKFTPSSSKICVLDLHASWKPLAFQVVNGINVMLFPDLVKEAVKVVHEAERKLNLALTQSKSAERYHEYTQAQRDVEFLCRLRKKNQDRLLFDIEQQKSKKIVQ